MVEIKDDNCIDYTEQDKRVREILKGIDIDNDNDYLEALTIWEEYLTENLVLPFEARIFEYQDGGSNLQAGDIVTVNVISGNDDLYGLIVKVKYKRKSYDFPLCDLEVIDKDSANFQPLRDYAYWFANR